MMGGYQGIVSDEDVRAMRDWLVDCGADPDEVETVGRVAIIREVATRYVGGLDQFYADAG